MGNSAQFTINFSEYYAKRNCGELTETAVNKLKESIGKTLPVQLPFTISEIEPCKRLEIFLSKISDLWTCIGVSKIIDVRHENNVVVMICDVTWAKAYQAQPPIDAQLSPAGLIGTHDKLNCVFNLAGFILMPK